MCGTAATRAASATGGWVTANELKRMFPNASAAFLAANTRPPAVVERAPEPRPLAAREEAGAISGRVLIRITSRRRRLIDPDNLSPKAYIDCLRYAGILADDTAEQVSLETRQEKVGKDEIEETVIEIYEQT